MTESPDYGIRTYGEQVADVYDRYYGRYDPAVIVALKELAGEGPALELGIGTGRVALPLREAGVDLRGIDASPEMVAKLRAKPGGEVVPISVGSGMARTCDSSPKARGRSGSTWRRSTSSSNSSWPRMLP